MKQFTMAICVLLCISNVLIAQPNKINGAAIMLAERNNPGEAAVALKDALADTTEFMEKSRHVKKLYKGYFYYAVALAQMVNNGDTTNMAKFDQPAIDAHIHYNKVMSSDEASKWERYAKDYQAEYNIWSALYNRGLSYFNSDQPKEAARRYELAVLYKPKHILTNRMLGASAMLTQDTATSIQALETAIESYKAKYIDITEKEKQELLMEQVLSGGGVDQKKVDSSQLSYMVQQLAVVYDIQGEPRKALDILKEGMELSPGDEDMKRQELNIYNRNPDLFEEAKEKFQAAVDANPDDLPIKLAYAALLERNGEKDAALELYRDAYERDSDNLQANYRLAAYYVNEAAELSAKKGKMNDSDEIKEADEKIVAYAEKAYPYLKWLHDEQPNEQEWLQRLVEITGIIGKDDEMMEYGKKLGEMNKN